MDTNRPPGRIVANGEKDEAVARLLERTEWIMQQHEDFRRALDTFAATMDGTRGAVSKLESAVDRLNETMTAQHKLEDRVGGLEDAMREVKPQIASWQKVKDKAIWLGAVVVLLALAGGSSGFALIKAALNVGSGGSLP